MTRSPQPGEILGDRYRVLEVVGSGGMGVVYRAQNVVTAKYVALKWLRPLFASGAGGERLLREARAASLLKHPHIVDVYDLTKDSASDTWVLVMELLQGETLRQYILRSNQAKLSSFIALLVPAMEAVVAAHELGIVHRDLKPENIFLERVPYANRVVPKVLDFGIAKLSDPRERTLTVTGTTLGTPFYMAPEQYRGDKDIDARTDVYAFGAMLYEAITGQMPHAASSLPELALKVTTKDAEPVKNLCPSLPTRLARLVDWSLAREREERLPTLRQMHDELQRFALETSFRGEMTPGHAAVPLMALPAVTAETLAETQLGVRLNEMHEMHEISHADKTPAPLSKTKTTGKAKAGGADAQSFASQSSWIAWSLLVLAVITSLVLYRQRSELESNARHAAAQLEAAAKTSAAASSVQAASARECMTSEATDTTLPLMAAAGATAQHPPPATAEAEQPPSAAAKRAIAKLKNQSATKQEPASSRTSADETDPKRSISKILAF